MKLSLSVGSWLNDARGMRASAFCDLVGAVARCDDALPDDDRDERDVEPPAESGARCLASIGVITARRVA